MSPRFISQKRIFPSFRSSNNKKSALIQKEGSKDNDHNNDNSDDSTANQTLEPSSPITTTATATSTTTTTNSTSEEEKSNKEKKTRKKCVRFPSVVSLENTRQISRLSSRSLEEVKAMWEDEEEEKQRKANLKKDLKKHVILSSCQEEKEGTAVEEEEEEEPTTEEGKNNENPKLQQQQKQKLVVDCSDVLNDSIVLGNDSSSQFTALGLEDKVGPGLQEKRQHRENAWDAVMWEQHYQYEEGRQQCDYDVVARVYEEQAKTTQLQAKAHSEAQRLYEELLNEQDDDPEVTELMSLASSSTHSRREM